MKPETLVNAVTASGWPSRSDRRERQLRPEPTLNKAGYGRFRVDPSQRSPSQNTPVAVDHNSPSVMSLFGALFSAVLPTVRCEDQQPTSTSQQNPDSSTTGDADTKDKEDKEDVPKGAGAAGDDEGEEKEGGAEEEGAEEGGEEEEEEEAEDIMPQIREDCANTPRCAPYKKEFEHCEKKVHEGTARHHEDCVEELFHMMHCVDACSAPKLFSKLV